MVVTSKDHVPRHMMEIAVKTCTMPDNENIISDFSHWLISGEVTKRVPCHDVEFSAWS
jgi:hypothetical protein